MPSKPGPAESLEEEAPLTERTSSRTKALAALMDLTDARLVPIARSGDSMAFEALYRKHVSFAIHLATRIEGSSRDVEDIVHDAFIKAFARLGDLSDPAAFRSWLGSIVVFAVRSRLRRARLMSLLGLGRGADPIDLDSITSSDASPHTRAQLAQIYALLRTLPTDERISWTLRYVEGHELDVVGKLTGKSLATVKRRITKAQKFLEQHFVDAREADGAEAEQDAATPELAKSGMRDVTEAEPAPASTVAQRRTR
jgi:RNA polymerase sigma-70 factor (ECF subfamily)